MTKQYDQIRTDVTTGWVVLFPRHTLITALKTGFHRAREAKIGMKSITFIRELLGWVSNTVIAISQLLTGGGPIPLSLVLFLGALACWYGRASASDLTLLHSLYKFFDLPDGIIDIFAQDVVQGTSLVILIIAGLATVVFVWLWDHRWEFIHVGIAIRNDLTEKPDDEILLVESTAASGGVRFVRLGDSIREYHCPVLLVPPRAGTVSAEQQEAINDFLDQHKHDYYAYSHLVGAVLDINYRVVSGTAYSGQDGRTEVAADMPGEKNTGEPSAVICSELVAGAFQQIGLVKRYTWFARMFGVRKLALKASSFCPAETSKLPFLDWRKAAFVRDL